MYLIRYILLNIESLLVEKKMFPNDTNGNTTLKYFFGTISDATKTRKAERGTGSGERENEKWEQGRVLQLKSLIGQGFNLSFAPDFLFPVPCARSQLPFLV